MMISSRLAMMDNGMAVMTGRGGEGRGELHDAGEPPFLHWQNLLATQKVTLSPPIAALSLPTSAALAAWHVAACDYKYSASPQLFDEISALPAVVATPQPLSPHRRRSNSI